ncbi:ECF transporter S component [Sediminispirochaeta smaragdinae]|jgi:energy-coupling factor transport system substrate-specific component|uniref:Signal transduction histidine kinase, LytS n=1 Tax=Sediminispirochaeta smaragdinae (strain DSM 11293 / JCM 15392 / SEBR 4228) TaxID=573413 RepID=E1R6P9_SEDSS|nr:ECF transporter S component [Sediminispirochaeta smaragdinae]ADK79181.1 conserved hypothetical protein [Sediminispirochaeta smaragdinae DSM 11293]
MKIRAGQLLLERPGLIFILFLGMGINLVGYYIVYWLELPLFLDSMGTFLAAAVLGPWLGAACGFFSNLLIGLIDNPVMIPFALVNIVIGIIVGLFSLHFRFRSLFVVIIGALVSALVSSLLGTVITVFVFGGVSGGVIDAFVAGMATSGREIFSSTFLVRLPVNIGDKLFSAFLIWIFLLLFPERWKGYA